MADSPPDEPARKKPLLRTFVPSLLILVGTFFFISSACFSDGSSGPAYYYDPCENVDLTAPEGAVATIVTPTQGELFSQPGTDGLVYVPVKLSAEMVQILSNVVCRSGTGYFLLRVERTAGEGCVSSDVARPIALSQGETEIVLRFGPGSYELTAEVVSGNGVSYEPPITGTASFVVEGEPIGADAGVCP